MCSNLVEDKSSRRRARHRAITLTLAIVASVASLLFGVRTTISYRLLRSATEIGAPSTSNIRGWMTLSFVAGAYHVPSVTIAERLRLPADIDPQLTLRQLAEAKGVARLDFVQQVQRAVSKPDSVQTSVAPAGWLSRIGDAVLSAVLTSGYIALGATFFLGAFGVPVPSGVAALLAGSLAAQGRFDLWAVLALGSGVSTLGDLGNFLLGSTIGATLLTRYGRWIGLTPKRRSFIEFALEKWGVAAILLSRTLASSFSTLVSLFAGIGNYSLPRFLVLSLAGRSLWTAAYVCLGYTVGQNLDAAASFLLNLSGLLFSLLLCVAGIVAWIQTDQIHPISPR